MVQMLFWQHKLSNDCICHSDYKVDIQFVLDVGMGMLKILKIIDSKKTINSDIDSRS